MRRKRKERHRLLSLVTAGPGLVLGAVVCGIIYAELKIAPLFSGNWAGSYTSRIWSAPTRLRAGRPMTAEELRWRLADLHYAESAELGRPGAFHQSGGRFEIFLRGARTPRLEAPSQRVELALEGGRLRSVRQSAGARAEAALEPELLYEMSGSELVRREPLDPREIPEAVKLAVMAAEDRRFYQHPGVDLRGVARAAVRNLTVGRVSQGGSTLTQQLARNLFLTQKRTFARKGTEALIAFYMESRLPKDQILRMYLDSVYLGQLESVSVVGLKAAARHYFDRSPTQLTLAQCALLAGMLQSPRLYDPFEHPEAARGRRDVVLSEMVKAGFLSEREAKRAQAEGLGATRSGQYGQLGSDYFADFVRRGLVERMGRSRADEGGIAVYTTLDPWLQEAARRAVRKALQEAALVALDPRSGAIRALAGGRDFSASPFDRATQARRQPGSSFKPVLYAAALESGAWTPETKVSDSPRRYRTARGWWTPKNYDRWYRGQVALREALAQSLNGASVKLAHDLGPEKAVALARALGITSDLKPDLGVALGVYEVSLLELAGAYCAFANGGLRAPPYAVEAALDSRGGAIEEHEEAAERALSTATAAAMDMMLHEVVRRGTAKPLSRWGLGGLAAGKTGTTDEGKDAWFIGYTPRLLAGVWTGSDLPQSLGLSGGKDALPIWAEFMRAVYPEPLAPGAPPEEGPGAPATSALTKATVEVTIDPGTGLLARSGCPVRMKKSFPAGSEPTAYCTIHPGGVSGWFHRLFK